MNRAIMAVILMVFSVLLGGCLAGFSGSSETAGGEGSLTAIETSEAPPNATVVNYSDDRVAENKYLQKAVRKVVDDDSDKVVVTVPEDDVEQIKKDLQSLPFYDARQATTDRHQPGYYVEYMEGVVRVKFVILD